MSFSELILNLINKRNLDFEIVAAPEAVSLREDWLAQTVPLDQVARVSILQDDRGIVMALYPATQQLGLPELKTILHRDVRYVDTQQIINKFNTALQQPNYVANAEHGTQIIIDEHLTNHDIVYFEAPRSCSVIKLKSEQLGNLSEDALLGSSISIPKNEPSQRHYKEQSVVDLKQRIAKLDRLPAMPDMPAKIMALRNNPNSTVDDLVALVEKDMSLSAQIIRYSNSALFQHHGPVTSLKDSIFRVLGYETVLHLSLGYALGRVFKLPEKGPLGNTDFWQHATYSAALSQHLAQAMPKTKRPKPGIAYLSGLLHDIGFLVLNIFFHNEYEWLNKVILNNPGNSIMEIEKRLLGITHMELGAWLMKAWKMPVEICTAIEHHHDMGYTREFSEYALIVNLSERLLKMHGISDSDTDEIPPELLNRLGLQEEQVYLIMDSVLQGGVTLQEMARAVQV